MNDTPNPNESSDYSLFDPEQLEQAIAGRLNPDSAQADASESRHAAEPQSEPTAATGIPAPLTSALDALDLLRDEPVPAGLALRVNAHVQQSRRESEPRRTPHHADWPTDDSERMPKLPWWTVLQLRGARDAIAVAAVVVLMISLGAPSVLSIRDRSSRVACSQNLASIGAGVAQYSTQHAGSLPFGGWTSNNRWLDADSSSSFAASQPNRRHVEQLLTGSYVVPSALICPSQPHIALSITDQQGNTFKLGPSNLSYSYQNMSGARPTIDQQPDLPIFADENPLFTTGLQRLDLRQLGRDAARQNSPAHRSSGQNILTAAGQVRWSTTPNAGIDSDNIWTLDRIDEYTGVEGPREASDAHLIK